MCGIAGFVTRGWTEDRLSEMAIRMAGTLLHRGPDDGGVWIDTAAGIALGHRRLAVIDPSSAGHQPMISGSGRYVMVFNGEIYNFRDLRFELQREGVRFQSTTDTEVLLAAIDRWGLDAALRRSNGMFALGVWDRVERSLALARDRLGEKPLYYGWQAGTFMFASELRAMRAHPDFGASISRNALARYLALSCVPAPMSIYDGIVKVPPGTVAVVRLECGQGLPVLRPYWSVDEALRSSAAPTSDDLAALITDAVQRRMVADVPLGALLSGGIDSATVVALMQEHSSRPVRTFTVGFRESGFDESVRAGAIARHLGTDHTELHVSSSDAESVIPRLPEVFDEPFADSSQIPTHLVCALARRSVTVALTGDGGDELFGGYNRYLWWDTFWNRTRGVPRLARKGAAKAIARIPPGAWDLVGHMAQDVPGLNRLADGRLSERAEKVAAIMGVDEPVVAYERLLTRWTSREALALGAQDHGMTRQPPLLPTFVEQMMYLDLVGYLPDDVLTKVDRASMAVSLEVRVPFLDHRVVEAAWRLPLHDKIDGRRGKLPLRTILDRHLPRDLVDRPKAGFAVPIGEWLRGRLRPWAEELLDERRLRAEGFLDAKQVRRVWEAHLRGRPCEHRLWAVLMFEAWLARERNEHP